MIKLFLDTEFTDLVPDNKLISIALVTEDGRSFYAELTDTYERRECSDFVMNFVLPFLKGDDKYQMTQYECALALATWIEELGEPCVLGLDNISWDFPHLRKLLNLTSMWPANLEASDYFKFVIMDDVVERIVTESNFNIHNALDDAMVMSIAYRNGEALEI